MNQIGYSSNTGQVYAGNTNWGTLLSPQPLLLSITILKRDFEPEDLEKARNLMVQPFVLIDDGYDPVTRTRRGQLYKGGGSQPQQWFLAAPGTQNPPTERLITWRQFSLQSELGTLGIANPIIAIGSAQNYTFWDIVSLEESLSGVAIVYLRARHNMGVLPQVNYYSIEIEFRSQVEEKLKILLHDIQVASAESIVDSSREALTCLLSVKLQPEHPKAKGSDLNEHAKKWKNLHPKKPMISDLAFTVARLHSRRKNSEQEKHSFRQIDDQDAELAVSAVAFALKEFEWTI